MVRIKNTTKNVDNILCEDAGLKAPDTVEKCGNIECPKWISTDWSPCRKSKCFTRHTALQKRDVSCVFGNETVSDKCDENEKPTTKQECYNELCVSTFRVEQWSEVSVEFTIVELFMETYFLCAHLSPSCAHNFSSFSLTYASFIRCEHFFSCMFLFHLTRFIV